MDFDEEMSSLQIEDLGEYFFPTEDTSDNWKGFSLGYMDDATSPTLSMPTPIPTPVPTDPHLMDNQPILSVSPPFLSSSFSEMLRECNNTGKEQNALFGMQNLTMSQQPPQGFFENGTLEFTSQQSQHPSMGQMPNKEMEEFLAMAPSYASGTGQGQNDHSQPPLAKKMTLASAAERHSRASSATMNSSHIMPTLHRIASAPVSYTVTSGASTTAALCPSSGGTTCTMDAQWLPTPQPKQVPVSKRKTPHSARTPPSSTQSAQANGHSAKRSFNMIEPCSANTCAPIVPPKSASQSRVVDEEIEEVEDPDDRGFRKKSREKMRRQEVNVQFDDLVELLGLSNRARKSSILQEAVSAIKNLTRERDELRRDRDRLQHEVSRLATCLQFSHMGSVAAAANVVAMSQQAVAQQGGGLNSSNNSADLGVPLLPQTTPHHNLPDPTAAAVAAAAATLSSISHPIGLSHTSGYPIYSAFRGTFPFGTSSSAATPSSIPNMTPIAPKLEMQSSKP